MDSATESYLVTLSKDASIWRRRGKHGAICFIDGVIEALVAAEAISTAEASKWNIALMSSSSAASSEISPPPAETTEMMGERNETQDFPHFLELIPIDGAFTIVPGVCSMQILGIERYDTKAAIIWRVVPLPGSGKPESLSHFAQFETGPNRRSTQLSDDVGTQYIVAGGHSGGRIERVGRFEFRPAPPESATLLFIRWNDVAFDLPLS